MTDLIADTNVWYDIGAERRDPVKLKSGGNRLVATPTSLLEISSLINNSNFSKRKKAAQAVVDHADEIAPDCEYHLATLWGLDICNSDVSWFDGFQAIAQAPSASQLQTGVKDFQAKVTRTVNVALSEAWRTYHWDDFKNKVIDAVDKHVSGYKNARATGKCQHLNKEEGERFAEALRSKEARDVMVKATLCRALLVANQSYREPDKSEFERVEPFVAPYVDAYTEYLVGCATEYAPQSNDLGDSECFLYLQAGKAFLSSDKRWVKIAKRVCPSYCLDPEEKVS